MVEHFTFLDDFNNTLIIILNYQCQKQNNTDFG